MNERPAELVFDTGPLSHFAIAGWLGALRSMTSGTGVVVPDAVEDELRAGVAQHAQLQQVLDAPWIRRHRLESPSEIDAFAYFASRLVVGTRNLGEAAVLAYARVHGATAVIDDGAGRAVGREAAVEIRPTLALLCEGIRSGLLTAQMVSQLVDHLIETQYRLPFAPGGFMPWARENGQLP